MKGKGTRKRKGKQNAKRNKVHDLTEKQQKKTKGRIRLLFWNVAGIRNKGEDFWKYISEFDVIGMVETWVDEKEWKKIEERMPKDYAWRCQAAERKNKKGRAKGGIITGVRKEIEEEIKPKQESQRTGVAERDLKLGTKKVKVVTVYSQEMSTTKQMLEETISETEKRNIIIGGDFNARIGTRLGRQNNGTEETRRASKDKTENKEGRKMMEFIEERGYEVLNGNWEEDAGEFTYVGPRGESVIDYAIVNQNAWDEVRRFEVGNRAESDHQPLEIEIAGEEIKRTRREKEIIIRTIWEEENIQKYRKALQHTERKEEKQKDTETRMKELERRMREATTTKKIEVEVGERIGRNRWWDKECKEMKRLTRKEMRKWRNGNGSREEYRAQLKKYKDICKKKKEEKKREEEEEIRSIKTEEEVWKYINRERKTKKGQTRR